MRKFLTLIAMVLFLSSCDKDPEFFENQIFIKATYDGEPLVMFDTYLYPDGKELYFTRISFFVNRLVAGEAVFGMNELEYVDLTNSHSTEASAIRGFPFLKVNAPEKTDKIVFDIGVDPNKNNKVPADFASDNVLSRSSEYWPGWKSYIFARVEGKIDLNGDGLIEEGFSLHMGGDDALRKIIAEIPEVNGEGQIDIVIDLKKFFESSSGNIYDIDANPNIHRPDQNDLVMILADNLAESFN